MRLGQVPGSGDVWLFATPGIVALQAPLSSTISQNFFKFMSIESVMLFNYLILCQPLLLPPSISPSIRVFFNESALCIRWPKYGALTSASVFPMNIQDWVPLELTGLISLKTKGLSRVFSGTTIQKHQFFSIPPSLWSTRTSVHDYWKNHNFDYMNPCWQTDSLLFNTLYRFVMLSFQGASVF